MAKKSMQVKYNELISLIEDYLNNMHKINNKRLEFMHKDVELSRQECKLFSLLQNNIKNIQEANGIS